MKKRIIGMLYGIFLEKTLDTVTNWKARVEKDYLMYCRRGCEVCYRWKCGCRQQDRTPYRKFRRGKRLSEGGKNR